MPRRWAPRIACLLVLVLLSARAVDTPPRPAYACGAATTQAAKADCAQDRQQEAANWGRLRLGRLMDTTFHYNPGAFTVPFRKHSDYITLDDTYATAYYRNSSPGVYAGTLEASVWHYATAATAGQMARLEPPPDRVDLGAVCGVNNVLCLDNSDAWVLKDETVAVSYSYHRYVIAIDVHLADARYSDAIAQDTALIAYALIKTTWPA
jgi:hypothetical protein